jgi:hypothetical protein
LELKKPKQNKQINRKNARSLNSAMQINLLKMISNDLVMNWI